MTKSMLSVNNAPMLMTENRMPVDMMPSMPVARSGSSKNRIPCEHEITNGRIYMRQGTWNLGAVEPWPSISGVLPEGRTAVCSLRGRLNMAMIASSDQKPAKPLERSRIPGFGNDKRPCCRGHDGS